VKRELREETGIECEPETLICMEVRGSGWYRMAFAVQPIGGALKKEPDLE
jgi:8-oxo-dGDP phosphatase